MIGNYWWAEWDERYSGTYRWRPVLQCDGFTVTCDGPWFATERECLDFVRREIVGAAVEENDG